MRNKIQELLTMQKEFAAWLRRATPLDVFTMVGSLTVAAVTVAVWIFGFGEAVAEARAADAAIGKEIVVMDARLQKLEQAREEDRELVRQELNQINQNLLQVLVAMNVKPAVEKQQ
jgi:hypothetical protein